MLNWMIIEMAWAYLALAIIAQIGALQIAAARRGWVGLSIFCYRRRPLVGYALGAAMILGAYIWFFGTHPDIFRPGPAGAELTTIFLGSCVVSVSLTLLLAELRRVTARACSRRWGWCLGDDQCSLLPYRPARAGAGAAREPAVSFGAFTGSLHEPEVGEVPGPAVVLVPGPYAAGEAVQAAVEGLRGLGFWVLAVDLRDEDLTYPEVLAVVPTAISFLAGRPQVDAQRIAAAGFDIGANIVLRSASTDQRVKALVAISPLFSPQRLAKGLALLHEMSYVQAVRWSSFRARGELVSQLDALGYMRKLKSTPALLILGERDELITDQDLQTVRANSNGNMELHTIEGATHYGLYRAPDLVGLVTRWFGERVLHGV